MSPAEYLDAIKSLLLADLTVASVEIRRERSTLTDGHLRARLRLINGSELEFSEYVQHGPERNMVVITYSYHWADAQGNLIARWDNTPHFPDLPGFPHHIHDGVTGSVTSGEPVDIFSVLNLIGQKLAYREAPHAGN